MDKRWGKMKILIVVAIGAIILVYLAVKFFPMKATYVYMLWSIGLGIYLLFLLLRWFVPLLIDVVILAVIAFFAKATMG